MESSLGPTRAWPQVCLIQVFMSCLKSILVEAGSRAGKGSGAGGGLGPGDAGPGAGQGAERLSAGL